MKCPSCETEITFTWAIYAKHGLGRFTCKECGTKYKHDKPVSYYIWVLFAYLVQLSFLGYAFELNPPEAYYVFLFCIIVWPVVFMIIDKKLESGYPTKCR